MKKYIFLVWVVCFLALTGCSNFGYYSQAIVGHLSIQVNLQPVAEIIADSDTAPELRIQLQKVLDVRQYASEQLFLPDNASYTSYTDLKRPYVLWNVVAAPEFSLEPRQWCFPFAGCVQYRGYYAKEDAMSFAAGLSENGDDIYIGGVAAYSTLGWFADPMLNTILFRDDTSLAGLIFHELAHQQLYVKNDSAFNEGFAKTVEIEGVRRWLASHGTVQLMEAYEVKKLRHIAFIELVAKTGDELQALYQSEASQHEKRQKKAQIFAQMRSQYLEMKASWQGYSGYDNWFEKDINNAQIAAVNTYRDYVPAFQALLEKQGHKLPAFYQAAKELGALPKEQRSKALTDLL